MSDSKASFLKIEGKLHNVDQIASVDEAEEEIQTKSGRQLGKTQFVEIKFVGGETVILEDTKLADFEARLAKIATIVDGDEPKKAKKPARKGK